MWLYVLLVYVALNLVLAVLLHFFTFAQGERPARIFEVVVYFAVFAVAGTPLLCLYCIVHFLTPKEGKTAH